MGEQKKISLIFLDVDGVLTENEDEDTRLIPLLASKGYQSFEEIPTHIFDQIEMELFDVEALLTLAELIEDAETRLGHSVGIVLTSDWRLNRNTTYLKRLFQRFSFSHKLFSRTYSFTEADVFRSEEILHWFKYFQYNKKINSADNVTTRCKKPMIRASSRSVEYSRSSSPIDKISSSRSENDSNKENITSNKEIGEEDGDDKKTEQEETLLVKADDSTEWFEVYSFIIIDDHDFHFSEKFPDQFISCRHSVFNDQSLSHAALEKILVPWNKSKTAVESLKEFNYKKYSIASELFADIKDLEEKKI
jgi:hypothetical protein